MQADDSGAWLWCSKDDWVIDAVRKVCAGAWLEHGRCVTIPCRQRA